jgi:predicted Zn-dependent peptidase
VSKFFDNAVYNKTVLPGGVRVLSEQIPHVRSVSVGLWVQVGTRDENPIHNGISHFIEHMMFKGTARRSAKEIAECLETVGGHINAFTGKELTCYYCHVLDENLPLAVDVLSDILVNSQFEDKEILRENSVVVEEINAVEDDPEDLVHDYFHRDLFPSHALGFSTLGTREIVESLTRDQLLAYSKSHYTQSRLVLAAAGNVHHQELCDLIANSPLHALPMNGVRQVTTPLPASPIHTSKEDSCAQAHLCVGTRGLPFDDPRKYSLLLLNTLLGGGMSSRLFQTIREQHGLAYNVFSFLDFMLDTGVFGVYVGTDGDNLGKVKELLHTEFRQVLENGVGEDELQRTKSQLKGSLMLGLESTSSRMNRLAKMEIYLNRYYTLDDVIAGIDAANMQELVDLAKLVLDDSTQTTTLIKPEPGTTGT